MGFLVWGPFLHYISLTPVFQPQISNQQFIPPYAPMQYPPNQFQPTLPPQGSFYPNQQMPFQGGPPNFGGQMGMMGPPEYLDYEEVIPQYDPPYGYDYSGQDQYYY